MEYEVRIKTESPLCLNSGKADVNVDADIVHDALGLPYFPGKRLRGLLYESAVEVVEMAELCEKNFVERKTVEELFNKRADSTVELIVPNFHLEDYQDMAKEWKYLQSTFSGLIRPESVLQTYTSIRFQTALDTDGTAKETSLRNIRVLDSDLTFVGKNPGQRRRKPPRSGFGLSRFQSSAGRHEPQPRIWTPGLHDEKTGYPVQSDFLEKGA